ncbi:MAG: low temperature requirement protein A [Chloroflexota bacterium]|nr:low temperature requirement protein A [Chloroflexota bacterium]
MATNRRGKTVTEGERRGLLRERGNDAAEVAPVELFFDLVYVLAITQVTHHLLEHLSPRGVAETLVLLLAVWVAWIHVAWSTNYFDLGTRPVRLALLAMMLGSLVMSASIPGAFAARGLAFAAALVAIRGGWTLFLLVAVGWRHHLGVVFARVLAWDVAFGVLLLAGGLAAGSLRLVLWILAVGAIYGAMWARFPVPGLGRSRTSDYTIVGALMAHRWLLFVILALGESILIIGANFGELPSSATTTAAFGVAFVGSAALWWLYFDRAEEGGMRVMRAAADPGALALSAYTYFHIPMVAGIVAVAAGDELLIAHPDEAADAWTAALVVGGPLFFLTGQLLFKRALWRRVSHSRLVAIAALALLLPLGVGRPTLGLALAATGVLVALAAWDLVAEALGLRPAVPAEPDARAFD